MPHGRINIGGALLRLRGKRPRVDVAAISGVSARTIEMIETGKSPNPTIETILALCEALEASPIEFLKDAYPDLHKIEPIIVKEPGTIKTDQLLKLIEGFGRASPVRRAFGLTVLHPLHGRSNEHFRKLGVRISAEAAVKLAEILGEIERLITADQDETY